jgi:hypothetical protein
MGVNARYYWTTEDMERLVRMAAERTSTQVIASRLGRTEKSVRNKASALGIALTAHGTRRVHKRLEARGAAPKGSGYSRAKVRVTVDFDISALTREERLTLAARLLDLSTDGEQPVELPPAYDAIAAARERYKVQVATKGHRGKNGRRGSLTREERAARRAAARDAGLGRWVDDIRFGERLRRMREQEYVRDMLDG